MDMKELLKLTVEAVIAAGPEGWCRYNYWLDAEGNSVEEANKVCKACVIGRASLVAGNPVPGAYHISLNQYVNSIKGFYFGLSSINDGAKDFNQVVESLNRILEAA